MKLFSHGKGNKDFAIYNETTNTYIAYSNDYTSFNVFKDYTQDQDKAKRFFGSRDALYFIKKYNLNDYIVVDLYNL